MDTVNVANLSFTSLRTRTDNCLNCIPDKPNFISRRCGKYYHYVQYLFFFMFTFIISWVCLNPDVSQFLPKISFIISDCEEKSSVYCYGITTIYRANFGLVCFYTLNLLTLTFLKGMFEGCYILRWGMFLTIGALSMLLPNFVIYGYILIAFAGAIVFLALNVIILIDFAYQIEQIIRKHHHYYRGILVNTTLGVLILVTITLSIVNLVLFDCLTGWIISLVNIILALLTFGICFGLSTKKKRATLLSCCVITTYNTYIVWSSLNNGLGLTQHCYLLYRETETKFDLGLVIDSLLTLVTIIWTAFSIGNYHNFITLAANKYSENIFYTQEAIDKAGDIETGNSEDSLGTEINSYQATGAGAPNQLENFVTDAIQRELQFWKHLRQMRIFFIVMILASFYLLASMSSWQLYNGQHSVRIDSGLTSMWIKLAFTVFTYMAFIVVGLWNRNQNHKVTVHIFDTDSTFNCDAVAG